MIPLLQRRRLFRTEYAGTTLREHYALAWPPPARWLRGLLLEPITDEPYILVIS
ncbi:MAG: hypothetical protein JO213_19760 [Alphaproteobacteria bacterium]|nr:hypothetical protein [Alphaproteobacteria bacterium]MBV9587114.1 hypothetical protein [Alphaproteobacteria bacterium]MBV9964286.1 hypothetical protein [Alphaproteobacteria bacterium]